MGNELEHIVILETSDVHGNIFPVNYADNSEEQFGLVKLSTIVKNERKRNSKLILIDNGDTFQGTPITYYYAKIARGFSNPVIDILNYMKYDAAVIGNHEFNYGMEILNDSIKQSKFPWLSCNIIDTKTKETAFGVPYIIKEFRGDLRIAILGVTTKYIPNWENQDIIKDLKFLDVIEETKKWVRILKNDKKVDIVVVSYHGGFEKNIDTGEETESQTGENQAYELCNEVDGIDVLLTGHQHREIYGMKINGVTIIQPGSSAKNIGKVDIIAEKTLLGWRIVESKSSLISVSNISSDYKAGKIAEKYEIATQAWLDTPIGRIKGDMTIKNPIEARLKDNALIEFINKVQMINGGTDISATSLFSNSKGFPKKVTMRDIVSNYVYPNTLKVMKVKGKDIKDALELSAAYFDICNGRIKEASNVNSLKLRHYNYDMWEGIEYEINVSKKIGERVTKLNYKGMPVNMEQDYNIALNNYRAAGGGNYYMFKDKEIVRDIPIDISELIANYFLKNKEVVAEVNKNWKVIHD